jgi:acetyl esterase/lipase
VIFTRRSFGLAAVGAAALPTLLRARSLSASGAANSTLDPLRMVDPELRDGAKITLSRPLAQPLDHAAIKAMRQGAGPAPAVLSAPAIEMRRIPGAAGQPDVAIAVIGARPDGAPRPAVLHIHGGGFIVGRMQDTFPASQRLAEALDCVVIEVEYRLSPETVFPGPLEDCHAALVWVHGHAASLGVDPARIALMGESAGGGLAAMVAIAARDRASVPLCYQVLIYPMLDDRTGSTRRVPPFIGTIGWNEAGNVVGWTSLLGQPAGSSTVPAGAVPARIASFAGLPPTFIGVGAIDLFVDEDVAFAQALIAAGVPVQLLVVPGAYHGFDFTAPASRASRTFTASWKSALSAAFDAVPTSV